MMISLLGMYRILINVAAHGIRLISTRECVPYNANAKLSISPPGVHETPTVRWLNLPSNSVS